MSDETTPAPTEAPAAPAAQPAPPPGWQPPRRRPGVLIAIGVSGLIAILVVLYTWQLPPFGLGSQRTENAYIRGRTTVIAPQVSGYVTEVLVSDYQVVKKGAVLVRIDDATYAARVAQARATLHAQQAALENSTQARAARAAAQTSQGAALASTRSQLTRAQADARRADGLVSDGSISQREYDQTLAALRAAEALVHQATAAAEIARQDVRTVEVGRAGLQAQVEAAEAALRAAELDLERTTIVAPEDGQLGEVGVRIGQFVAPGTTLLAVVPADRWIIANYKEAQTGSIRVGQSARFSVDALDGARFTGTVEQVAPAAGSEFAALKPDNATGNFVKVPQRIGVRIRIDPDQSRYAELRPGMSVQVRVNTRHSP
jgi:multidrug resistance efflux pump